MAALDLVAHLAVFGRALRERGIRSSLSDEADALAALAISDVSDRDEVRTSLKIALKIRRRDEGVFEELFARLWGSADPDAAERSSRRAADNRRSHVKNFGGLPGALQSVERVQPEAREGGAETPG